MAGMRLIAVLFSLTLAMPAAAGTRAEMLRLAELAMKAQIKIGDVLRSRGDLDGALAAYEKARAIFLEAKKKAASAPAAPAESREKLIKRHVATLEDRTALVAARYDAAVQLGDLGARGAIDTLVHSLENDANALVQRAAARSIGRFGKDALRAVPALIRQVGAEEPYVGYMSVRALGEIMKGRSVSFGFQPTMTLAEREAVRARWEAWWKKNAPKPKGE